WLEQVPLFHREQLQTGHQLIGPALILEATGTIVLDPGFRLVVSSPLMVAEALRTQPTSDRVLSAPRQRHDTADPVLLEVMNHSYVSIAEQMGEVLRRTAISTNIRERLDF